MKKPFACEGIEYGSIACVSLTTLQYVKLTSKNLRDHLDLVLPGCKDVKAKAGGTRGLTKDVCCLLGYLE